MTTVDFAVLPVDEVDLSGLPPVSIEAVYDVVEPGDEKQPPVRRTIRLDLDPQLRGTVKLANVAAATIRASALAADGSALVSKLVVIEPATVQPDQPRGEQRAEAVWELDASDVALLRDGGQQLPGDVVPTLVTRVARFMAIGRIGPDFARSAVGVLPVADAAALTATGLEGMLSTQGGTRISAIDLNGQDLSALGQLAWQPAHLGIDGTVTAAMPQRPAIGWLWWLTGPHQVAGFMVDDLDCPTAAPVLLSLPALAGTTGSGDPTGGPDQGAPPGSGQPAGEKCGCGSGDRLVPANINERELADNPDVFAEDPGSFCTPFSNPERVVSEKSFSVVARVTQPDIGPVGTSKLRSLGVLNLDAPITPRPVGQPGQPGTGVLSRLRSRILGLRTAAPGGATTTGEVAALLGDRLPVRNPLLDRYADLIRLLPGGRTSMNASHPLQWEDDMAQYQASTVCLGHILEFRVRWRSNGYSLGTVAKTLTLAPRQTKRIQKIEWQRTERSSRAERTQLTDQENDSVTRERDYDDRVAAHLDEWSSGGSTSSSKAVAGGIGFAVPGLIGGIGGGAGSASSTSHQEGGRDTSASELQRLRDSIRRHGDALRRFESTVVNEVTEVETVTGTTEIIRNPNYGHALTVIYYQILRHLKITTELAGVRECLFVPFAIRPFDVQRAYRWRESIQKNIRAPRYARALRYLKDVATGFSTSSIAPGPRAGQQLTFVRGSIYVKLAVERPRDGADGAFDSAAWQVAQPLLDAASLGVFSLLAALDAKSRDAHFQAEHAPGMAARWSDRIDIQTGGGRTLSADCTLASRYGFNQTVRIDFSVSASELAGLSRQDLTQLRVLPQLPLPPGSVANLTRVSLTYNTDRFEHSAEGRTGTNDLIKPISGLADPATVTLPLDGWERVDERLELIRAVDELVEHLNEHVEYYQKAVLWEMDRDRLLMMLDGFYVPNSNNVSLATVVDREPIAIIGNCLVYRVGAASFLGFGKITTPEQLRNLYADRQPASDPLLLSLPTDGLYAQTIMDECEALEQHFGNTDWALNDPDPDLSTLDPVLLASRRTDTTPATTPTPFPGTIINLQNAPDAPAPQGLAGIIGAVTDANAFRDMAGLAGTQANARAALETAAGLASTFGNQAAALELAKMAKAEQGTRTADQKLASIQKAKDAGLTSPEQANQQATSVLQAMNPGGAAAEAPHANPAINAAITAAKDMPGSMIEASTEEGSTKVTLGEKTDSSRPFIIEVGAGPALRAFGPSHDITGVTRLSVRSTRLPAGTPLRWSIPPTETGKYTITQTQSVAGVSEAVITGVRPGLTAIDVDAIDGSAPGTNESIKFPLSIPQFITIDDQNAQLDAFMTANNFTAVQDAILAEARAVAEQILLGQANVRLIWKSTGARVPATVPASMVTRMTIGNTDPSGKGRYGSSAAGPSAAGVGDTAFDEVLNVYPASFVVPAPAVATDVDAATNELAQILTSLQASDPVVESWIIRVFGRLIGETLAHETFHSLLPVPFVHNVDGSGNAIDTRDIMDQGSERSFLERTGIIALSTAPGDFIDHLTDNGRAAVDGLVNATHLASLRKTFPIPPTPPFDR
ncbi:hypothetical protein [Streptomyces sp. YKOK-I1]